MRDLTDFEKGQIVGARMTGASITKVAEVFGFSRATISRTMTQFEKQGKTSNNRTKCGRPSKLSGRDRRTLNRIIKKNRRSTATKVRAELNQHLSNEVSTKTVRRELHNGGYHGRAAIRKPLLSSVNIQKRMLWCKDHKTWSPDQWRRVIFSDESSFSLFPTSGRVYVWRQPKEAFNPDCLLPTVKHGGGSVMVWAAISRDSLGPIVALHGRINSKDYLNILGDQVHPMCQTLFPEGDAIFQDDNAPIHTARIVKNWHEEHDSELEHMNWPPQSPDLNIIEHLWCTLEQQVRNRYPPPSCLDELEKVLMEEWLKIPIEQVKKLYDSIPRRIEAVLKAKGGPTPY